MQAITATLSIQMPNPLLLIELSKGQVLIPLTCSVMGDATVGDDSALTNCS